MAGRSLKKNYILNLAYQLLVLIIPFVTTPYLSRVLGADGIGIYSYANSIVTYFVLVATLGTTTYAQRRISYIGNNKEERSRAFWEIFIFRLMTSLITLAVYLVTFTLILKENFIVYIILSLNIINVVFDVSWFLQGMEEFGKTVFANAIFKVLNVVLIFVFVKTAEDLNKYILITASLLVLSNAAMWLYLPKYLCKVKNLKPFKDIKDILQLFVPTVALQIYTILDKSMIGWFTDGKEENGYYEQAEKVIRLASTVVVSLGTVMVPRIAMKFAEKNYEAVEMYLYKSYRFVWMLSIPLMMGIIAVADVFVPIFFGDGYEKCIVLLSVFSVLFIFLGLSNVTNVQFFVPTGRQNLLTLTVTVGAVVNLILNLILIPLIQSVGACIASVIAEFCVTLFGFIIVKKRKLFSLKPVFSCCWKYCIAGTVMGCGVWFTKLYLPITVWSLIVLIALGIAVYFLMLVVLRDKFLIDFIKKGIEFISKPFNRKNSKEQKMYDYLIVGAGLYGAVFAREAVKKGKKVLVIDKRTNVAGNIYTEEVEGINVHKYGAHIFHTNNKEVWDYVNEFATFNRYTNSPVANYKGELYSLPFNMYTFNKMWGVVTPDEAAAKIEEQRKAAGINEPKNLEEQAISLVGTDIYEKLIKGYTQKQWGRPCTELPSFIIKRLPVRLTFDNNYFNALYQGIPVGGYTKMIENMLDGIEVRLNCDYLKDKETYDKLAKKVIYTGAIDAYFDFKYGALEYRSVRFETEVLDKPNFQGNAVVNYTDAETPFTRIIEHKFFEFGTQPKTVISREYSSEWHLGDEPYYPVNDEKNGKLYEKYKTLAESEKNVIFGGRLGEYKYYDMDAVIASALNLTKKEL